MTLRLYYHPFASFCQKALIALYENEVEFERELIDLGDPEQREALRQVWPLAKFPVLVDEERGVTIPESTLIIEYLHRHRPGPVALVPDHPEAAMEAHLWDRFFDNYIASPLTKIVVDTLRPEGRADPQGVEDARALIATAYEIAERKLAEGALVAGHDFTLADCAAAPTLFYANIAVPFAGHPNLAAYYERLLARPSFRRVIDEARPHRQLFPLEWPDSYR